MDSIIDGTTVTIKHSLIVESNNRPCHTATASIVHYLEHEQIGATHNHKLQFDDDCTGNLSASISRNRPSFSLKGRFDSQIHFW